MHPRGKVVWSSDPSSKDTSGPASAPFERPTAVMPQKQVARLVRERKGRGGKVVTVIDGLVLSDADREALARDLRKACGAGGTVRGEAIEIQGDLRDRLAALLRERGYQTKLVGG